MIARKVVLALVLLKSVLQLNLASYLSCFDHAMEPRGGEGAVFENGEEEGLRWQLERWFSNVLAEDFPFSTKGWKLLSLYCPFIQWLLDVEIIICKSFCQTTFCEQTPHHWPLTVPKHHTMTFDTTPNPQHLTPHHTMTPNPWQCQNLKWESDWRQSKEGLASFKLRYFPKLRYCSFEVLEVFHRQIKLWLFVLSAARLSSVGALDAKDLVKKSRWDYFCPYFFFWPSTIGFKVCS